MREQRSSTHPSRQGHRPALASCGHRWALFFPLLCRAAGCLDLVPSVPDCVTAGSRHVPVGGAVLCRGEKSEWPGLQWGSASPGVSSSACDLLAGTRPDRCLAAWLPPITSGKSWQGRSCCVPPKLVTAGK